jgi:hypothetical protein
MKAHWTRCAAFFLVVVVATMTASGCNGSKKGDDKRGDGTAQKNEPPVKVDGEELTKAFKTDSAAADAKYKGKFLEVKGKVHDIYGKEVSGEPTVVVWGYQEKPLAVPVLVQCYFTKEEQDKIGSLKKDDVVTVRGNCEGALAGIFVVMRGCELAR